MKKVEETFYCDLCGKRLEERILYKRMTTPFVFPVSVVENNGKATFKIQSVTDICHNCANNIMQVVNNQIRGGA